MTYTEHAMDRIAERLSADERADVARRLADIVARGHAGSVAVRVARLQAMHGYAWSDVSNGSDVWAVIRDGQVRTVMLRRRTQPTTKHAFNVDRVILAD